MYICCAMKPLIFQINVHTLLLSGVVADHFCINSVHLSVTVQLNQGSSYNVSLLGGSLN